MHCDVDIVEKVESFADELVTILEEAILDLALARRVEVVGVRSSGVDVFSDGERLHESVDGVDRQVPVVIGLALGLNLRP